MLFLQLVRPHIQVLVEQLHDRRCVVVLVSSVLHVLQLLFDAVVGRLRNRYRLLGVLFDFVEEDAPVELDPESQRVAVVEFGSVCFLKRFFIGFFREVDELCVPA